MEVNGEKYATEEDLKVRFLVPLLEEMGLQREDMVFEESFSLKVGRSTEEIDSSNLWKSKSPRLDILVKEGDKNLLVIEVKAGGLELTNHDRDQACSYAMLTFPRTPYALVTNGINSNLYRAYDQRLLDNEELLLDSGYKAVLPSIDDFDPLLCFLRLSETNLAKFCSNQVERNMHALRGSKEELHKKYIPELHVHSKKLACRVFDFLESDKPALAITGDSGIGKTCAMCREAESHLEEGVNVLFFRGTEIGLSLSECISQEFSWTFSEQLSFEKLVKKISSLTHKTYLLIFIDAIDEWGVEGRYEQLSSLVRQLGTTNVKLIFSCKSSEWSSLTFRKGVESDLKSYLFSFDGQSSFNLASPSLIEQRWMLEKYENLYQVQIDWDYVLKSQIRTNPLLMRIAFDTARSGTDLSNDTSSSIEIYRSYLETLLEKIDEERLDAREILRELCQCIVETGDRNVSMSVLRSKLGISKIQNLPADLFSYGILEKVENDLETTVRFVFEGLQNYVLVFLLEKWHTLNADDFILNLSSPWTTVVKDAVFFYYEHACDEHKRALDRNIYEAAGRFLEVYEAIATTHFSTFMNQFPGGNPREVSFVIEYNLETAEAFRYGLKKVSHSSERVVILPTVNIYGRALDSYGAHDIGERMLSKHFCDKDPLKEMCEFHLGLLIQPLIEKGKLDETDNPDLANELVNAVVYSNLSCFRYEILRGKDHSRSYSYKEIMDAAALEQNRSYLERRLEDHFLATGHIEYEETEYGIQFSGPNFTHENEEELTREARALTEQGERNSAGIDPMSTICEMLETAMGVLGEKGTLIPSIAASHRLSYERMSSLEAPELEEIVERVLVDFLENYKNILERNFPTLKQEFELYSKLPITCEVCIFGNREILDRSVKIQFLTYADASEERNRVFLKNRLTKLEFGREFLYEGKLMSLSHIHGTSIREFFKELGHRGRRYPEFRQKPFSTLLRNVTYTQIDKEFEKILDEGRLKSLS